MTLALVSSRRNRRSRAQTSIFTIENQHFLVQMAPQASWPPDVPAESLEASTVSPQQGVLSQASSARIPQPGVLSQDSSARSPQQRFLSQDSSARSPQPSVLSQESSAGSPQQDCSARIPWPGISSQELSVRKFSARHSQPGLGSAQAPCQQRNVRVSNAIESIRKLLEKAAS